MSQASTAVADAQAAASTSDCGGLAEGTRVLTLRGEQPVQDLRPGDRIITRDAGAQVLRRVSIRDLSGAAMTRLSPDSLGVGRPGADILLAPGQRILLRDWRAKALYGQAQAMVPVSRLIDGQYIAEVKVTRLRVFELEFDRQHVIYAEGLELASATLDATLDASHHASVKP